MFAVPKVFSVDPTPNLFGNILIEKWIEIDLLSSKLNSNKKPIE